MGKFDSAKRRIDINDVNIVNILVSSKYHLWKKIKYFLGCVNHSYV